MSAVSCCSTAARTAKESVPSCFATVIFLTCSGASCNDTVCATLPAVALLAGPPCTISWSIAMIRTLLKNGFAQRRDARRICLLDHLGQHDIHIITRPDQARDARLRVNLDADGTAIRCQDAGEETPISRAQYVL